MSRGPRWLVETRRGSTDLQIPVGWRQASGWYGEDVDRVLGDMQVLPPFLECGACVERDSQHERAVRLSRRPRFGELELRAQPK